MSDFLTHYGVQGQKWGERRYQYQDGSYTPEGRIHYGIGDGRQSKNSDLAHATEVQLSKDPITPKEKKKILSDDAKKALMIVGGVALAAGIAYGVYSISGSIPTEEVVSTINESLSTPINTAKNMPDIDNIDESVHHILSNPDKYKSAHTNPITFRTEITDVRPEAAKAIQNSISEYVKINGVPNNALLKNSPNYGSASLFGFAKANPDVLAFSNSMIADAYASNNLIHLDKLTNGEKHAAKLYTGTMYHDFNTKLRTGKPLDDEHDDAMLTSRIKLLTSAINKHELPTDVMLHRAIDIDNDALKDFFYDKNIVGKTFFDKAYGSTSLSNYDTALNKGSPTRMSIHAIARKGTKAMYMEPLTTSTTKHELELLLQRGSGYKILDVVKDNTGRITDIFAQIVQPETLEDI